MNRKEQKMKNQKPFNMKKMKNQRKNWLRNKVVVAHYKKKVKQNLMNSYQLRNFCRKKKIGPLQFRLRSLKYLKWMITHPQKLLNPKIHLHNQSSM